jgi:hypothetical protein
MITLGITLPDSEKAEVDSDSPEAQFQPVTLHSVLAVIEMVGVALESYLPTPVSEPKLTGPEEVHQAIGGLKLGKTPCPNGIMNRALKHLPKRRSTFLSLSLTRSSVPITFLQYVGTLE